MLFLVVFGGPLGNSELSSRPGVKVTQPIVEFIKLKEGYRSVAYQDAVGVWTIGYGHTGTAKSGMAITKQMGEKLLRNDLDRFERYVQKKAQRVLLWNEFGSLVSFCYNLGYRLKGDLLNGIRSGNSALVAYKINLYIYAGGRVLPGLVKRRNEEARIYTHGWDSILKRWHPCKN